MWMTSRRMVRAFGCQCQSRNCPGCDLSIFGHSGIWGAADEAVLNNVHKKRENHEKSPLTANPSGWPREREGLKQALICRRILYGREHFCIVFYCMRYIFFVANIPSLKRLGHEMDLMWLTSMSKSLGLKMRAAAGLSIFHTPPERIMFIFIVVSANPTRPGYVLGVYLVNITLLLIGQGSRFLLGIGWTN